MEGIMEQLDVKYVRKVPIAKFKVLNKQEMVMESLLLCNHLVDMRRQRKAGMTQTAQKTSQKKNNAHDFTEPKQDISKSELRFQVHFNREDYKYRETPTAVAPDGKKVQGEKCCTWYH